jgi:high-affinity Fe2+/Pb2+ permease
MEQHWLNDREGRCRKPKGFTKMTGRGSTLMALAMIAAFLLIAGGIKMARTSEHRKRGVLMVVAAAVLIANVLIWTL